MPSAKVVVKDLGYHKILEGFSQLDGTVIEAGLFEDAGEHDGIHLAQIGFYNEYGTDTAPPRPWLSGGAEHVERKAMAEIVRIVQNCENIPYGRRLMRKLAKQIADGIRVYAKFGPFVGNAPSTIRQKGFDWPLIETGDMVAAIDGRVTFGKARVRRRR